MEYVFGPTAAPPQTIVIHARGGRGDCPQCGGVIVNDYCTCTNICCCLFGCIFAFLPGLCCFFMCKGKKCDNCGRTFDFEGDPRGGY